MYDVFVHNSLPTSAILALGLLKKKERKKMMNNFAWAEIMLFGYLALHRHILAVLKVATNVYTTVENAYTVKWPESVRQRRKTGIFIETASETPYCTIRHIFSRFWHSCELICKQSSSIHNSSYW